MEQARTLYLNKLQGNQLSNTSVRRVVFEALLASNHTALDMKTLISQTNGQADRASVYRAVEALEKIGVIKRLHIGWKYKLELSDDFHGHHHHMTCISCGQVHATHDDLALEKMLQKLARDCNYQMTDHHIDIRGFCKNCQKNRTPA